DDLSALIEDELDHSSKSTKDNEIDGSNKLDDLSALIDEDQHEKLMPEILDSDIDDLSALIEDELDHSSKSTKDNEIDGSNKLDDLSALIDEDQNEKLVPEILDSDLDDLLSLIGDDTPEIMSQNLLDKENLENDIVDDLSALIDESTTAPYLNNVDNDIDDLSAIIGDDTHDLTANNMSDPNTIDDDIMDDLSAIIEEENKPQPPKIHKPRASLEDNFEQYKAEVINIIIKLRKEGHTVDEATELLNSEGIKTLSGKERWTTKMIAKIYTFIETAEK
ncbi:MAG: hypothetical protein HQK65_09945, partial [Desulfamplus sp.]|nr:hypothetical protein [Desulfamplus sp.]